MPYGTAEAEKWAEEMGLLVFECVTSLGRDLTAYIGGARHVRELERWTTEPGEPARIARERLEAAWHIVASLTTALSMQHVIAWFRDPCPELGDISPATALHLSTTAAIHPRLNQLALRQLSPAAPIQVG
jgi:hypothetical protein